MKNYQPFFLLVIIIATGILLFQSYHDYNGKVKKDETTFRKEINGKLLELVENQGKGTAWTTFQEKTCGQTMTQFEGPQVHLIQFEYEGKFYDVCDASNSPSPVQNFKISNLIFDPDDPDSGKPDISISIDEQPHLYNLENLQSQGFEAALKKFQGGDNHSPYKTFSKDYFTINEEDSTISRGVLNLDVWLTKFNVTFSIDPHKGAMESDGDKETAPHRYTGFRAFFKVIPNYAPWYTSDWRSYDEKPDIAVGGIYIAGINVKPKLNNKHSGEIRRTGNSLELKSRPSLNLSDESDRKRLFEDQSIFNRPDTISIFFNNLGTYLLQPPDEITYTFIMPIIVKGDWAVKLPADFYAHLTKRSKESLFSKLLPSWGINGGKFISKIILFVIIAMIIMNIFPILIPSVIGLLRKLPLVFKRPINNRDM